MLHASCADAEVAFEYMHVECTARIGNVVSLRLWTSKILSSCALQTLLLPLTHNLAKVPPSAVLAFSRPSPSPSLFALVDLSAQITAWTAHETERFTSMFGFCAGHRQGSSLSVLSRGVLQQSGILVVWSHFRPSNVVLKSIDSTSHTVREIDSCTAALAACTWCKFDSSSFASWTREGTHGNHKMAICRAAASQSFRSTVREEEESWCSCDEDACHERTRARRPGCHGSEICKVSKRKFQLCQKENANSIFFWNPLEWNAWLSVVQRV